MRLPNRRLLILLIGLALLLLVGGYLRRQLAIDSCLDLGGQWDYSTNECQS